MSAIRGWQRTAAGVLAAGVAATALSGCEFRGAASLPLPGGEGHGSGAYKVNIEFQDVLDLVPQSAVKVNQVSVGSVDSVEADGFIAHVVVSLNEDVELPENVSAAVRQTSLLGEKFVSFESPPKGEEVGELRSGATIPLDRTSRSAEIEEVLAALSLVLNGGSLEQLQTINRELVAALEGRESTVKDVLSRLNTFVDGLDKQKGQIVRALDSLNRLTANLDKQRQTIATALDDIPGGTKVLDANRADLTKLLVSLDKLGDVAVRVINASQANTVADLKSLVPILTQINRAGDSFPKALELLTTYPFPRTVSEGIKGDFANLFVTVDADIRTLSGNLGLPEPPSVPVPIPPIPPISVPLPGGLPPISIGGSPSPSASASPSSGGLRGISVSPVDSSEALLRLLVGGLS